MPNPVNVYWSPLSPSRADMVNWLWGAPKSLLNSLPKYDSQSLSNTGHLQKGNYRACQGAISAYKNTYVFFNPITLTAKFSGDPKNPFIESERPWWNLRESSLQGCYAIDYDFGWLFFSDEDVVLKQTPPYMHRTTTQQHGWVSSGSFNIGKWFRSVNLSYHLWEGESELPLVEGEASMYLEFITPNNRPVNLQQFTATPELLSIAVQATTFKDWLPNQTLESLYQRFTQVNTSKKVLALIKANLVE